MNLGQLVNRHLPSAAFLMVASLAVAAGAGIIVFTGVYNIGADAPHSAPVYNVLEVFRDRAIQHHARSIFAPPDLDDPERLKIGAGLYSEMCSNCHLAPGMAATDLSEGLYPQAPVLSLGSGRSAAEQFWMIKHGVKLSAMPAWGRTHSDDLMWDMVAFVRRLPAMTPAQYAAAVAAAPSDSESMADMPGMASGPNKRMK